MHSNKFMDGINFIKASGTKRPATQQATMRLGVWEPNNKTHNQDKDAVLLSIIVPVRHAAGDGEDGVEHAKQCPEQQHLAYLAANVAKIMVLGAVVYNPRYSKMLEAWISSRYYTLQARNHMSQPLNTLFRSATY